MGVQSAEGNGMLHPVNLRCLLETCTLQDSKRQMDLTVMLTGARPIPSVQSPGPSSLMKRWLVSETLMASMSIARNAKAAQMMRSHALIGHLGSSSESRRRASADAGNVTIMVAF